MVCSVVHIPSLFQQNGRSNLGEEIKYFANPITQKAAALILFEWLWKSRYHEVLLASEVMGREKLFSAAVMQKAAVLIIFEWLWKKESKQHLWSHRCSAPRRLLIKPSMDKKWLTDQGQLKFFALSLVHFWESALVLQTDEYNPVEARFEII